MKNLIGFLATLQSLAVITIYWAAAIVSIYGARWLIHTYLQVR